MLLVLLVARVVERFEPGLGPLSGITVGLATLVLPFSTMLFVHVLSALLGFAAFALLVHERDRRESLALVGAAGLLAGLAVTTEYALVIVAVVLGLYAVSRRHAVRRAAVYVCSAAVGLVPLLLYNRWAFGSTSHLSYADAIAVPGKSGHDVLGLNGPGLFGVGRPHPRVALELLFSNRGLLVLSPVLALAGVGTVLLYRRGWRAEALTIGVIALAFLAYDSGYVNPFGGDVPGPRFLIPAIPFLGVALAPCYRRLPGPTLALAVASACLDGGRDRRATTSPERRHRALVAASQVRGSLAHGAHLARVRSRLGLALALSPCSRRGGRACRVEHDLAVVRRRRRRVWAGGARVLAVHGRRRPDRGRAGASRGSRRRAALAGRCGHRGGCCGLGCPGFDRVARLALKRRTGGRRRRTVYTRVGRNSLMGPSAHAGRSVTPATRRVPGTGRPLPPSGSTTMTAHGDQSRGGG